MNVAETIGRQAEDAAVEYLRGKGHKFIVQNWKTKWCEIDIVSKTKQSRKSTVVHFTEVKYRNTNIADGLNAVTPKKLAQMKYAAEFWLAEHGEDASQLDVLAVTGEPGNFSFELLENVTG